MLSPWITIQNNFVYDHKLERISARKIKFFLSFLYCFLELSVNISLHGAPGSGSYIVYADPNLDPDPSIYS
jgi:hypothetical protein